MKKILVRADDLGYSEGVNYGLVKSIKEGIIRSAGVMVNMPATQHGLSLLQDVPVCYGLHTNICVGKPLSDPGRIPSLVQENGEFKPSKVYRSAVEDFVVLDEVLLEIEAQLQRFIELVGEPPHYFEGHAVASANFFRGLQIVAQKHGLKYSGMPGPGEAMRVGQTKVYMHMESMQPDYDPLHTLQRIVKEAHEDACEVMVCHPGYLDGYILQHSSLTVPRTAEVDMACNPQTKEWLLEQGIEILTYDAL